MKRLTKKFHYPLPWVNDEAGLVETNNEVCLDTCNRVKGCDECPIRVAFERLYAYEETGCSPEDCKKALKILEANSENRVFILPVLPGDRVFLISLSGSVLNFIISDISICPIEQGNMIYKFHAASCESVDLIDSISFTSDDIGKTVFKTREGAEKALKKEE